MAAEAGAPLYYSVSEPQFCSAKDGAAVKCSVVFQGGDLTAALVPGEPLYLGFQSSQGEQVRRAGRRGLSRGLPGGWRCAARAGWVCSPGAAQRPWLAPPAL